MVVLLSVSISCHAKIEDFFNEARAEISFFPSLFANWIKYDDLFNYNRIAGDVCSWHAAQVNGMHIDRDKDGNLKAINDGKKVPLMLASIPLSTDDFDRLRNDLNLSKMGRIAVFSLNQKWERKWSGLKKAIKKDKYATLYKYPTIDFTAPTLIDTIRIVRDMLNRDGLNTDVVVVHCKSGRGRSATAMAAYLDTILFEVGLDASIDQIEAYMIVRRKQVKLNAKHRLVLQEFKRELRDAGSFDVLLKKKHHAIKVREKEVKQL